MLAQGPGLLRSRAGAGNSTRLSDEAESFLAPEILAPLARRAAGYPGCGSGRTPRGRTPRGDRVAPSSAAYLGRTLTIGIAGPVILEAHLPACGDQTHTFNWTAPPADPERGRVREHRG